MCLGREEAIGILEQIQDVLISNKGWTAEQVEELKEAAYYRYQKAKLQSAYRKQFQAVQG